MRIMKAKQEVYSKENENLNHLLKELETESFKDRCYKREL